MSAADSFQPHKRTLGELLASTSPPLRVPDFQRDYSWAKDQITEFWDDIVGFGGTDPKKQPSMEYFLGATVLVNSGTYHLVLDGQQRLATATILLAAIRDKMPEYKATAAQQLQDNFIVYTDQVTGETVTRLELNKFDRNFFRDLLQTYPKTTVPKPTQKSHYLIAQAYAYFAEKITEGWEKAGGGKQGFEWVGHISVIVRQHIVLIAAISTNERSAASIFTTLNDRGIGLSSVDLVRSHILQRAHESQREEIMSCWEATFAACGKDIEAEGLMRASWVAQHGDLKTRALYKVVTGLLDNGDEAIGSLQYSQNLKTDAVLYRQILDGDTDDPDLEEYWLSLRQLKFNPGYPLLISAAKKLEMEESKIVGEALRSLILRHNVVCDLDRASLESTTYLCAKVLADGGSASEVVTILQARSPSEEQFTQSFRTLTFSPNQHGTARYLLELFDQEIATTAEIDVAGAQRVHVEHIYPQKPKSEDRWEQHATYVQRLGNLTLLDKRLNIQIKNGMFPAKRPSYSESRLMITKELLKYDDWSPDEIEKRQAAFSQLASKMWPVKLVR